MKCKNLSKKLTLNKTTVTNLSNVELKLAKGGDDTVYPCIYSAPQIVCISEPPGDSCQGCTATCNNCGGGGGSGNESCVGIVGC